MRYLSVCSGIEAVSVAWAPLGWQPAMFAEIEPFCAWLLHAHYGASRPVFMPSPDDAETRKDAKLRAAAIRNVAALPADGTVINAGDFTKIGVEDVGAIDLLAGGTPCQSFSVAGKRAGLDDPRGNLTIEFARLADRLRPLWLVWENVPGVLSIDDGRTFGAFLGLLVQLGYGIAYRVLNAQYFGVPQRRRRVFVVGCLGDWRAAAAVLLERESLSGYPPPRRKAREGIARGVEVGFDGGRFTDTAPTLDTGCQSGLIRNQLGIGILSSTDEISHCLNAGGMGRQDFESETLIAQPLYDDDFDGGILPPIAICTAHTKSHGRRYSEDLAYTLVKGENQAVAFSVNDFGGDAGPTPPTLRRGAQMAVAVSPNLRGELRQGPTHSALPANRSGKQFAGVMQEMAVRRLTPRECERLQGFPDDYTRVMYRGKLAADGPRYRALGNSMAVPVMRWIGERIAAVDALIKEGNHAR
jgi:DNA (cytosine-5)-methyltransferase 1